LERGCCLDYLREQEMNFRRVRGVTIGARVYREILSFSSQVALIDVQTVTATLEYRLRVRVRVTYLSLSYSLRYVIL
jgi:hypothetical protein